jgi:hypothetical protein
MLNLKCKRYLEAEGRKCGHPSAERRMVRKQFVGTFCFPCWLEVMPTLPLSYFYDKPIPLGAEDYAREQVYKKVAEVRKQWEELLAAEEAKCAAQKTKGDNQ